MLISLIGGEGKLNGFIERYLCLLIVPCTDMHPELKTEVVADNLSSALL